ncbi:MAG TPA: arginine--tRNA ligase [Planctomycetota bacterium]|nr:arginine--tRNA ligase [Planctomycetota bacterium]
MQVFADRLRAAIAAAAGLEVESVRLDSPRDDKLGDLALPCFLLAKQKKVSPAALATELAGLLNTGGPHAVDQVSAFATGPYVNFRIARPALARAVFAEITASGAAYGGSAEGAGKKIVIDFSSPNIAKPMHVGHIRSTILGLSLTRIFRHLGYTTIGINHIGDWGAQFGGLVVAIRRWRAEVDLEGDPVRGLLDLYQRSKAAVESDPAFREESIAAYRELESGVEGEVREIWRWVTAISLRGFDATYKRLGIVHEFVRGESFYEPLLEPTLRRVQDSGVTEISEGALIVDLSSVDKGLAKTPCLLRQTNGTTLYATRDLAALFQRYEEFHFERCLYVVGSEQRLHFRQLKAVLARMKVEWEPRVEHVDFGLLLGPGRVKLASRKGAVLVLDDLIDEVVEEARRIIREKNPDIADAERVAESVGVGAIVFNDLKRERIKDVVFDKGEILSFEGETGPYLQYTHARLASILRKAAAGGEGQADPDWAVLESAGAILMRLSRLSDVVRSAAAHCEPSEISNYLLALARDLNSWYAENRVLGEAPPTTAARLALIRASKSVLGNALGLLGITALEAM